MTYIQSSKLFEILEDNFKLSPYYSSFITEFKKKNVNKDPKLDDEIACKEFDEYISENEEASKIDDLIRRVVSQAVATADNGRR